MSKILWAMAMAALAATGVWLLSRHPTLLPPALVGLLMFLAGGLIGLRVGSDSAARFVKDILRLNKFLAEQNDALAEQNHHLLKRLIEPADGSE